MRNSTGKPSSNQAPDTLGAIPATFSGVIGADALPEFFARLSDPSFQAVLRRVREYRQRTRFNFLNSATRHEK